MRVSLSRSFILCVSLVALLPSLLCAQDRQLIQQPSIVEKRIALVIGNAAYATAPLKNPVNDAQDMTAALRASGFDVIHKENLDQNNMKRAIREFGGKIRNGGVALFYYAGHGLQVKGINYLVPVDAQVQSEEEVEYEMVDAGFVLAQMESANTNVNVVILDACRNNPFARSFRSTANGLAQMDAPSGTLIAYATAPGSIASDGPTGRNGLYTRELLKVIATPDLTIEELFKRVRISVRSLTSNKQTPWEASSLTGNFSFRKSQRPATDETVSVQPEAQPEVERVYTQQEVEVNAKFVSLPKPGYTEEGRKQQVQGVVSLSMVLRASGNVTDIRVVEGLPYGLSEQAIAAARQIRFTPAIKDGRAVSVRITFQYNFSLY